MHPQCSVQTIALRNTSLVSLLACFACLSTCTTHLIAHDRPNILLFMADDMTHTDLGCYGNQDVKTPNLDAFANSGMKLTRCFNSAPMCSPLRQSLYTGLYPVKNGAYPNHSRVYDGVKSLPHYLSPLGYRTALIGKRHEAPESSFPFEFLGGRHHDNGKGVDLDLSTVDSFLKEAATDAQPFCLVVTSNQPHRPWNRGDATQYAPKTLSIPGNLVDTPQTRTAMAEYYAEITYMDTQFGSCIGSLGRHNLRRNTIVIFLSEQGSNFPFCKWTCYATGIQSACLVSWPSVVEPDSHTDALVSYVDIVPTLVAAAGGQPEAASLDGRSILPILRSQDSDGSRYVFAVQTSRGIFSGPEAYGIRSVTDGRYLLIKNLNHESQFANSVTKRDAVYASWNSAAEAGDAFALSRYSSYKVRPEWELYDIEADPWNLRNVARHPELQEIRLQLLAALKSWMREQGDQGTLTEMQALTRQSERTKK